MTPNDRATRERKQKIFVAVGGLFLLALLAFEVPHFLGGSSGTSAASTTTTQTDATVGDSGAPVPVAAGAPASLVSSDRSPAPATGQLSSFSTFSSRDPFVQQVSFADSTSSGGAATPGKAAEKGGSQRQGQGSGQGTTTSTKGFTLGGSPAATATVISVNGARQALVPGAAFPASDPVFVLVSEQLKTKSVVIGVAGGSYASGSKTTKLVVGKPVVLVNTTTGARYRLVLVAVGNGEAVPKTGGKDAGSDTSKSSPTGSTP